MEPRARADEAWVSVFGARLLGEERDSSVSYFNVQLNTLGEKKRKRKEICVIMLRI